MFTALHLLAVDDGSELSDLLFEVVVFLKQPYCLELEVVCFVSGFEEILVEVFFLYHEIVDPYNLFHVLNHA